MPNIKNLSNDNRYIFLLMTYEEISLVATSTETAFDNHDVNRDTCVVGYPETEAIERQNNYPLV